MSSFQPTPAYVEAWKYSPWAGRHKHERHFRLVAHIFTKLSQNVCLINIHILIYLHARYDCKLWNALWFYYVFGHFHTLLLTLTIHVWIVVSPPNFHWKTDISTCQMSQQVIEWFYSVFASFAHNWRIFMSEVLYTHQTFTGCLSNQYIYFDMLKCQM